MSAAVLAGAAVVVLGGCAADDAARPPELGHIHAIAAAPNGEDLLIASHNGLFSLGDDGDLEGPLGDHVFDVMGFAVSGDTLFASGHPGDAGTTELGAPNLGLIRSDDVGRSWQSVALGGDTDFHSLTVAPDGMVYGIPSDGSGLLVGTDAGATWHSGASVEAVDLAATDSGLFAATPGGLLVSTDEGASFAPVADAPIVYAVEAQSGGGLTAVGTDGTIWSRDATGSWSRFGALTSTAHAFTLVDDTAFIVDERGIVEIAGDTARVRVPLSAE